MKRFSLSILCVLLVTAFYTSAVAESLTDAKRADIKILMEMTGVLNIAQQMSNMVVTQMIETLKKVRPDIHESMYDVIAEEVNNTIEDAMVSKGGYLEMMIPIYHKYYSHSDIKGLIAFYQTDLGKKLIKTLPNITRDSMTVGKLWGQGLGPVIKKRVRERLKQNAIDLEI